MSAPNENEWDQRPDEPPEAYARFLMYRNLGPARSLMSAYASYALAAAVAGVGGGRKPSSVPGQWNDDSAKFAWVERAVAWDIHTLKGQGDELGRLWLAILLSAARRAAELLADPECKPDGFFAALAVLDRLAPYIVTTGRV